MNDSGLRKNGGKIFNHTTITILPNTLIPDDVKTNNQTKCDAFKHINRYNECVFIERKYDGK